MSEQTDRIEAIIRRHAEELSEVCDSVEITVTIDNVDGDSCDSRYSYGKGSFYARWAALRERLIFWDQYAVEKAKQNCK